VNLTVTSVEDVAEKALKAKTLWLDWAEIIDSYRLVPRAVLFALLHMTVSLDTTIVYWFVHLPQRTVADATAVTGIVTVFSTLFGFSLKFYIDNGRAWNAKP
jgi:hypothetical protein